LACWALKEFDRPIIHQHASGKRIERAYTSIFGAKNGKVTEEWARANDPGHEAASGRAAMDCKIGRRNQKP